MLEFHALQDGSMLMWPPEILRGGIALPFHLENSTNKLNNLLFPTNIVSYKRYN